jgi:hypothetical protein
MWLASAALTQEMWHYTMATVPQFFPDLVQLSGVSPYASHSVG